MKCSMCDFEFDEESAVLECQRCAVFGGCQKVRCPSCGYHSPRETRLIRWLRRVIGKRQESPVVSVDGATPLSHGRPGATGVIAPVVTSDQGAVQKLMAMGLLPGVEIRLLRRFPSFVFQVDYSQFTIDKELAGKILVHWSPDSKSPH
jgi:Fe2+ transport system protein FeoA